MMSKFDLHVHTINSHDGIVELDHIVRLAKDRHVDIVAITDHDKLTLAEPQMINEVILLNGEEVTSLNGVHIIGLGITKEVKKGLQEDEIVNKITNQGGTVIIPHPYRKGTGLLRSSVSQSMQDFVLEKASYIEIENFKDGLLNNNKETHNRILEIAQRYSLKILYSSDTHAPKDFGMGYNVINKKYDNPYEFLRDFQSNNIKIVKGYCKKQSKAKLFIIKIIKLIYSLSFVHLLSYSARQKIKQRLFNK